MTTSARLARPPASRWASLAVALLCSLLLCADTAHAQVPVIDQGMIERNAVQTSQQILEGLHEEEKVDFFLRLLTKLASYDWRDFDEMMFALDDIMGAGDVLGYSKDDFAELMEETFPGYEDHYNWGEHHVTRIRRAASTYEAVLLSLDTQHERWDEGMDALDELRRKVTATITLGDPNGEGSKQTMMEIRAAARLLGQEETLMLRQAMLNRTLIRNMQLGNASHWRGHSAATIERSLGIDD